MCASITCAVSDVGPSSTCLHERNRRGDVVLVVLKRLLCRLADGLVGGHGDDGVDAADLVVIGKDLFNVRLDGHVALVEIDHAVVPVRLGRAGGEGLLGKLGDAVEGLLERVGEAGCQRVLNTAPYLSIVTTRYRPEAMQQNAMWEPVQSAQQRRARRAPM